MYCLKSYKICDSNFINYFTLQKWSIEVILAIRKNVWQVQVNFMNNFFLFYISKLRLEIKILVTTKRFNRKITE